MIDVIQHGEFLADGDQYTLKLNKLKGIVSIVSYDDVTFGELDSSTSVLTREFRYSVNNGVSYTSWATLNDAALQAISLTLSTELLLEVRYTRADSVFNPFNIKLTEFILDNIEVEEHIVVSLNKANFDSLYGTQKYLDLLAAISIFNQWSLDKHGVIAYVKDDNSISAQEVRIDNIWTSTVRDIDFNILLRSDFGKRFIKMFNDLEINPNKPRV